MERAASNCLILINYNNRHNLQWEAIAASGPNVQWGLKHGGPKFSLPGGPLRPLTEERKRAIEQKKITFTARARPDFIPKVSVYVYVYLPAPGVKDILQGNEVQEECIIHMFGNLCVCWAAHCPGSFYMCTHTPTTPPPPTFMPATHMCCEYWSICFGKLIDGWLLIWSSQCRVQNVISDKKHPIVGHGKRCKFRRGCEVIWIRPPCVFSLQ